MSFSSKYYLLDNEVLLNQKVLKNKYINKVIIPEPEIYTDNKYNPSNYYSNICNVNDNSNFGNLNSCTDKTKETYKSSDYIDKISNNSFISHIYERNTEKMDKIPFVDLHHNTQTQKGKFLLRNSLLNKIDDISHFDENLLEELYCKKKHKDKMKLLDTF
jgi:hypothetical protein